jgi:predicted DNA-binding protein
MDERMEDFMTGSDALQSVQFVTVKGKRFAVLEAEDWEALVEWIETVEDTQAAYDAYQALRESGGDRKKAGWVIWDDVEKDL